MFSILLIICCTFISYSLCKENKIFPLIVLNFLTVMIGRLLESGTYNLPLYVAIYIIYAVIVSYLDLFAYSISNSFIGFLFISIGLYIFVGSILFYAIALIFKDLIL